MNEHVEGPEAQLKLWATKIHRLETKTQEAGARARFEDLVRVDELKALHAIAQTRLEDFRAAGEMERGDLRTEMERVWSELEAALDPRQP